MSEEEIRLNFAEALLQIRKHFGLSQEKMAEKMAVSTSAYRYYEAATRDIPLSVAACAAIGFGVSLEAMIGLQNHAGMGKAQ